MLMKFNTNGERIWGTYFGGLYSKDITSIKSVEGAILFSYENQFVEDQMFGNDPFQTEIMGRKDIFVANSPFKERWSGRQPSEVFLLITLKA